jgi:hypothetical protein
MNNSLIVLLFLLARKSVVGLPSIWETAVTVSFSIAERKKNIVHLCGILAAKKPLPKGQKNGGTAVPPT